ncbi:aspartate/glutamate racemase family protein [Sphingomonas sp. MMS24-JH45]
MRRLGCAGGTHGRGGSDTGGRRLGGDRALHQYDAQARPAIEAAVDVPLLHIVDATGAALRDTGVMRVGLLGTAFTMEQDFYRERLTARWGVEVIVPEADDRAAVHRVIYDELVQGEVRDASQLAYREVMTRLVARGAGSGAVRARLHRDRLAGRRRRRERAAVRHHRAPCRGSGDLPLRRRGESVAAGRRRPPAPRPGRRRRERSPDG